MNGLLLNVICAFTIANANPNIEKAQQTLDALYQNYAATNTCLLRENYPFDQDNKATYLASEEQAKRRNEYSYLWPYSGTFSAVNALLESTENKTRIRRVFRHTKETIRLLILYQQSTSLRSFL